MVGRGINTMSSVEELLVESNIINQANAFLAALKTSEDHVEKDE